MSASPSSIPPSSRDGSTPQQRANFRQMVVAAVVPLLALAPTLAMNWSLSKTNERMTREMAQGSDRIAQQLASANAYVTEQMVVYNARERQNEPLIARRLAVWASAGPALSSIQGFLADRPGSRDASLKDILRARREVDALMEANRPIFSRTFFQKYARFMEQAFEESPGWRKEARPRMPCPRDAATRTLPCSELASKHEPAEQQRAYDELMAEAAHEFLLNPSVVGPSPRPSASASAAP